jgi:hypothetical protein
MTRWTEGTFLRDKSRAPPTIADRPTIGARTSITSSPPERPNDEHVG